MMHHTHFEQLKQLGIDVENESVRNLVLALAASPASLGHLPGVELLGELDESAIEQVENVLFSMGKVIQDHIEDGSQSEKRLNLLREQMKLMGIHAFIVPMHDAFFGEYVPFSGQRLPWLSGFTGSAGVGIVTLDHAAVFSDGRYTIQLKEQVDTNHFHIGHIIDTPPEKWLEEQLKEGDVLGLDGQLHNSSDMEKYKRICAKPGASVAILKTNPIDEVWTEQPEMPLSPVFAISNEMAGQSCAAKCEQIAAQLLSDDIDAVLITHSDSIAWLLNVRAADVPNTPFVLSYLILESNGKVHWFVDARKLNDLVLDNNVVVHPIENLADSLANYEDKVVLVDTASTAVSWIRILTNNYAEVVMGIDPCQLPKACKNKAELDGIKQAHVLDGQAMIRFLHWIETAINEKIELTEISVADQLQQFREQSDELVSLSFDTISGVGSNGAICHYRVSEQSCKTFQDGQLYLVDSGGQYLFGTTDITRVVPVGVPDQQMRRHFTLVLKGHIKLSSAQFPQGTCGEQLDVLARLPLWNEGLDYDHGTGHGVGCFLSVHEGPHRIAKKGSGVPLQEGMVVSNEPGYYQENGYGIRIENLVFVEQKESGHLGFENLTLVPINRDLIDSSLLDEDELAWLNNYHQRIYETYQHSMDGAALDWLKKATQKI
ncbi:MAG: M24 family metallopeptidase [bacterium]